MHASSVRGPSSPSSSHPMFSAARCLVPSLYPHGAAPTPTAVSAKPRRSSRRERSSWDDDGDGSSDSDVDDGFFGHEQDEEEPSPGRPASAAPQLRGSDVLRALQRAAAAKEAARNKKKPAARQRQGKEKPAGGDGDVEAREVRPVVIRPDWAARIRELDLRVRQLATDN